MQSLPFHERLKHERDQRGWSQEHLAEKVGSDPKTVGRWESGETFPQAKYRQKLIELFGIDAGEFGLIAKRASNSARSSSEVTPSEVTIIASPSQKDDNQNTQLRILREDLIEAPSLEHFYGRIQELNELKQWINNDLCRLVTILGAGGTGKTVFAAKLVEQTKDAFEYVFWRSLQNAPSLAPILKECIQFLSDQRRVKLPEDTGVQIQALLHCLREHRCLLILDNFESVFQPGKRAGSYQDGYEDYGVLLQRVGMTQHRSCLLLTSREKPKEVTRLEGKSTSVRTLPLPGVGQAEGQKILKDKGLSGSVEQWIELIARYAGNPLALKLISEFIQTLFDGAIGQFLKQGQMAFGDINELLDEQFHRLSPLEREILTWLAIEREVVSLEDIHKDFMRPILKGELLEALESLRRRSLIESSGAARFTLQPVIMEYMTNHLIKRACKEFGTELLTTWMNFAFVKAQAKDYVRESQRRLILGSIAERLLNMLGREDIAQKVREMFSVQRQLHSQQRGYFAANGLHLLLHVQHNLRGLDASRLVVRQAYLQGIS